MSTTELIFTCSIVAGIIVVIVFLPVIGIAVWFGIAEGD